MIKKLFKRWGYEVIKTQRLTKQIRELQRVSDARLLTWLSPESGVSEDMLRFLAANLYRSKGQLLQDLFVLLETGMKQEGYFVEFGAADGMNLSNTYLLEKEYRWRGILSEPATCWREKLHAHRTAVIDHRCVWNKSNEKLTFHEVSMPELSGVETAFNDGHSRNSQNTRSYQVDSITLNELLAQHKAPRQIDYMSIDTEGSELAILEAFDFAHWDVRIITVEHNHTEARDKILKLLSAKGFVRKYATVSDFDDWYVKKSST